MGRGGEQEVEEEREGKLKERGGKRGGGGGGRRGRGRGVERGGGKDVKEEWQEEGGNEKEN